MSANANTVLYKNACTIGAYLIERLTDNSTDIKGSSDLMANYTLICCRAFGQSHPQMTVDIAAAFDRLYRANISEVLNK